MSMSDATETATLRMHLKGIDPAYRAGATQYVALLTGVSPDEANPMATEVTYTGSGRIPLTKATAWSEAAGDDFVNAAQWQFGKRTDAGAVQQAKCFAIVDTPSGAVAQCIIGTLDSYLDISQNVMPVVEAGTAHVTAQ